MYFMHACIAINALINIIFEKNKSINYVLLQTTKNIPPLTILVGEIFELSPINRKGGSTAVYVQ